MLKIILIVTVSWIPDGHVNYEHRDFRYTDTVNVPWSVREQCVEFWKDKVRYTYEVQEAMAKSVGMEYTFRAKCVVEMGQ